MTKALYAASIKTSRSIKRCRSITTRALAVLWRMRTRGRRRRPISRRPRPTERFFRSMRMSTYTVNKMPEYSVNKQRTCNTETMRRCVQARCARRRPFDRPAAEERESECSSSVTSRQGPQARMAPKNGDSNGATARRCRAHVKRQSKHSCPAHLVLAHRPSSRNCT